MLIRFCWCFLILLSAILSLPISPALAQRVDMSIGDEPGVVPNAADEQLPLQFRRHDPDVDHQQQDDTIIVHTAERFLYVVQPGGRALRYGIGVGREGFQWQGLLHITRKQGWPDWTPPSEMIARQPYRLPHPRHQSAEDHRHLRFVRMFPARQWRRDRSLRSNSRRDQGYRPAEAGIVMIRRNLQEAR